MRNFNSFKNNLYKMFLALPTLAFSAGSFSVCPFCLPFYAGVFGLLGLEKGTTTYYLFIVLAMVLAVSLVYALCLAIKSKQYWQAVFVLCGFLITFYAKIYDMKILLYLGLMVFVISIFRIKKSCKSCSISEHKKTKN